MNADDIKGRGLIKIGCHLPYNPDLIDRAKEMRKNMTAAEKKLWYELLRNFNCRFRRQHPIDNYIVDFYCAELKLVVEIDGGQHNTEGGKSYDAERDGILQSYGLTIIRIKNREVDKDFNGVCERIQNIAKKR